MSKGKQGGEKGNSMWNMKSWDDMFNADHLQAALKEKDFTLKRLAKLQEFEGGKEEDVDELLRLLRKFFELTELGNVSIQENDRAGVDALFTQLETALATVRTASAEKKINKSATEYAQEAIHTRFDLLEKHRKESLVLTWYNDTHKGSKNSY